MVKKTGNRRPDAVNREYGHKPYLEDPGAAYVDTEQRVYTASMARRRVEPHSEFQRPWLFDDYLPMDEQYPLPFIYPDWPDMQPIVTETYIPENWDTDCWCSVSATRPLYCDDPVRVFAPSIMDRVECIDAASFFVTVNGAEVPQDRLTNFTIFGFDIEAPTDGWKAVPPITGLDEVEVKIYSRRDEKTKVKRLLCEAAERVFCYDRERCACPSGDFVFNDGSTPDTIAPGGSISVYVTGGCPPYSWSVAGTGYTLDNASTDGLVNGLNSAAGTCGVEYGPVATVTITDNCSDSVVFKIRNTGGTWALDETENETNTCTDTGGVTCTGTGTGVQIVGVERWLYTQAATKKGNCTNCKNASKWASTWGMTNEPPQGPLASWLLYESDINPGGVCCSDSFPLREPAVLRARHYDWTC